MTEEEPPTQPQRYRLRRAPRYRAFGFTGLALGVIGGLLLGTVRADEQSSGVPGNPTLYLVLGLGLLGVLLGLGAALLVERRRR